MPSTLLIVGGLGALAVLMGRESTDPADAHGTKEPLPPANQELWNEGVGNIAAAGNAIADLLEQNGLDGSSIRDPANVIGGTASTARITELGAVPDELVGAQPIKTAPAPSVKVSPAVAAAAAGAGGQSSVTAPTPNDRKSFAVSVESIPTNGMPRAQRLKLLQRQGKKIGAVY